jgi:hypothetical protein
MSSNSLSTEILSLLSCRLPQARAASVVTHYVELTEELQKSHWESATVKAGKFAEATLKCLWGHVGETVKDGKDFRVNEIIVGLERMPATRAHDFVRLTIPRACRFVYDIASNRGARHDSVEMNPNVMDANGVASTCSWILAELIRISQQGKVSPPVAVSMVAKLTEKKYPLFEEIDGRLYFANANLGSRKLGLLLLAYRYPDRMHKQVLCDALERHGETKKNANQGIARLRPVVDDDGAGNLKLRSPGLAEAERLLASTAK